MYHPALISTGRLSYVIGFIGGEDPCRESSQTCGDRLLIHRPGIVHVEHRLPDPTLRLQGCDREKRQSPRMGLAVVTWTRNHPRPFDRVRSLHDARDHTLREVYVRDLRVYVVDNDPDSVIDVEGHGDQKRGLREQFSDFNIYFRQWKHAKALFGVSAVWFLLWVFAILKSIKKDPRLTRCSDIAYYGVNLNQSVVLGKIGYGKGKTPFETLHNTAVGNIIVQIAVSLADRSLVSPLTA